MKTMTREERQLKFLQAILDQIETNIACNKNTINPDTLCRTYIHLKDIPTPLGNAEYKLSMMTFLSIVHNKSIDMISGTKEPTNYFHNDHILSFGNNKQNSLYATKFLLNRLRTELHIEFNRLNEITSWSKFIIGKYFSPLKINEFKGNNHTWHILEEYIPTKFIRLRLKQ